MQIFCIHLYVCACACVGLGSAGIKQSTVTKVFTWLLDYFQLSDWERWQKHRSPFIILMSQVSLAESNSFFDFVPSLPLLLLNLFSLLSCTKDGGRMRDALLSHPKVPINPQNSHPPLPFISAVKPSCCPPVLTQKTHGHQLCPADDLQFVRKTVERLQPVQWTKSQQCRAHESIIPGSANKNGIETFLLSQWWDHPLITVALCVMHCSVSHTLVAECRSNGLESQLRTSRSVVPGFCWPVTQEGSQYPESWNSLEWKGSCAEEPSKTLARRRIKP